MNIRPLHDRIIVKRMEEERMSAGGIVMRIGRISGRRLAPESVEASCNRGADGRARAMIRAEPLPAAVVRPVNLCI